MERNENVKRQPNPREGANIFSILLFAYTIPTFRKGFCNDIIQEDITEHLKAHDSNKLGNLLEEKWKQEMILHSNPSLWKALLKAFGFEYISIGFFLILIELVIKIFQPVALSQLIKYYSQGEEVITQHEAYIYASIIIASCVLTAFINHFTVVNLQVLGMKLRIACCSLIYKKALRLSKSVTGETTIGQIVNLLSNDVNRCYGIILHLHGLWLGPLQIIIIISILYYLTGSISTLGVIFMALFVPIQIYLGKKISLLRLKTALKTDERVRLMNEVITGIQIIKMYTWEKPFANLIAIARRLEINHIRSTSYIKGFITSSSLFTTRMAIFLTILTYVLLGNSPSAEFVFTVTAFYNIVRAIMSLQLPSSILQVAEFSISMSRLQKFLLSKEFEVNKMIETSHPAENKRAEPNNIITVSKSEFTENKNIKVRVQLQNATAKWASSSKNTLQEVCFKANSSEITAVIGPVGSGKTSLLHSILHELPLEFGNININGTVSYASQDPWIFSGTIQQNILFGQRMIQERYQQIIRICALEQDFMDLPYGDKTLVGERGVMLSGGQKARVSLARAVYKQADIYLLDDPLSAVDTYVGNQLFSKCIMEFLKNKCTILVTHQLHYLRNVDVIYLLENGKVTVRGTYQELKDSDVNFNKQFTESKGKLEDEIETIKDIVKQSDANVEVAPTEVKEQINFGSISKKVYVSYFKAGSSILMGLVILFLFVITQISISAADFFLTFWTNLEEFQNFLNVSRESCIYIYSGIIICMVFITLFRSYTFFKYSMKASIKLHNSMFSNIVQAPMAFFNTNSSGRILNRFSKDLGTVDEELPIVAADCIQLGLTVIGIIVLVSVVNQWLLIATGVIFVIFYALRVVYIKTSRSVKRLEGVVRSPIYSHMSASLQGLITIRAFEIEPILQQEFDSHQDLHSSVLFLYVTCARAFAFWLDLICVIYIAMVTFSFFFTNSDESGGNVGLAITQAMSLTGLFQWTIRQWTELENQMTSVERALEYANIEHETDPSEIIPSPSWPEKGIINFLSVSLRYSPNDPYVLKQLNFNINSNEKIGIVGRTGAGKSSLIYALYQLTKTEGSIIIDNIDITKISLQSLRSKISIIPQEPIMFHGSLRKNLDPFEEYPDVDLWNALQEVELKTVVVNLPSGLSSEVAEGGSNYSIGQRQLVCLARAIIRKTKILILDEATANVDPQTDELIQKTLRRNFANSTVLTIAHRLNTIMNSDKILVMDTGRVVEFDHPHLLLKNSTGVFYNLVHQSGMATAQILLKIAENSYNESQV